MCVPFAPATGSRRWPFQSNRRRSGDSGHRPASAPQWRILGGAGDSLRLGERVDHGHDDSARSDIEGFFHFAGVADGGADQGAGTGWSGGIDALIGGLPSHRTMLEVEDDPVPTHQPQVAGNRRLGNGLPNAYIHCLEADLFGGRVGHSRMRAASVFGKIAAV